MGTWVNEDVHERHEKILRGLLKLPANKRCINCNNLGPQYVCTNFSTFVCTYCCGAHREFTHRVKSVSMAKFTAQEVTAIQEGGNERAREVFFKEWDPQRNGYPDSSNADKLRNFIKHVYVERRYTGERSTDRPPRAKDDKDEYNENRRSDGNWGGSRSPLNGSFSDRQSYSGQSDDRNSRYSYGDRSPSYDQNDYKKSPRYFEVVDDRYGKTTLVQSDRCMEFNILELIVNGSEEPRHLDLALLQSITENFSQKKKIGSGGCGIVYKGILQNGIVVAVKRLLNTQTIKDKMFHREVISLISVKHQNIVRFLGYCSFTEEHAIQSGGRTIMADIRERLLCFEYIRNGNLEKYLTDELRGLEWQTRYQIIIGICRGLYYLHKDKKIIHMDLKPGNILLDDLMVPKITDFGLSRPESDSAATTTRFISQGYTAPEYISGHKATSKSDIYSLGVIITELVTGSRTKPNITKVIRKWNHRWIKSMKQSLLNYKQVKKCLELALRCIQDDPTNRPDISDIIDELKETDTKDGQTQIQISPCCIEDILGIEPLEIYIPFEDFKVLHSIELSNDTDGYIAFVTKPEHRYHTKPDRGVVPPRSKCSVTLAMQAQVKAVPNEHYTEVITVQSTRVDNGALTALDIDIFIDNEEGNVVDEVNVMVVFGTPEE